MENYKILVSNQTMEVIVDSDNMFRINGSHNYLAVLSNNIEEVNSLKIGNKYFNVLCKRISETDYDIWIKHHIIRVRVENSRTQLLTQFVKSSQSKFEKVTIKAPMPGLVKAIEVKECDIVKPGNGLIILEAMKMENEIRSPVHGKIRSIMINESTSVEKDEELIVIDSLEK